MWIQRACGPGVPTISIYRFPQRRPRVEHKVEHTKFIMLFIFWKPALWHVGAKLLTMIGAENKYIEWLIYFPQGHLLTFNANWRFIRRRLETLKIYNMDESVYCRLFLGPSRHLCPGNLVFISTLTLICTPLRTEAFRWYSVALGPRIGHDLITRVCCYDILNRDAAVQVLRGRNEGMWVGLCQNCTRTDPPGAAWYIPSFW